jgi:8-oxo-dGTP pyrophosphatase MutT (NUDIX family)
MYKIYINDTPLILCHSDEVENLPAADDQHLIARYPGISRFLLNYIDMLEKTSRYKVVALYSDNFEQLKADFDGLFKIIEAAGGVVYNKNNQILFIYRRGFWDLPKGKIDKGESKEMAAVREVQEETGLNEVELLDFITETYHTYRTGKQKRILKRTYWYKMRTIETDLVPQTEEDIEQAIWIRKDDFLAQDQPVYGNIKTLIENLSS